MASKKFAIWNRNYHREDFDGETAQEALQNAYKAGHIKSPAGYRKYRQLLPDGSLPPFRSAGE